MPLRVTGAYVFKETNSFIAFYFKISFMFFVS